MKIVTARINRKLILIFIILALIICISAIFLVIGKNAENSAEKETETFTEPKAELVTTANSMKDKNGNDYFPSSKLTVYLTFDDGPSKNTPQILSLLKKYGIGATFFVINGKYNHYMKDIAESKSSIALHSYSHRYPEIYSSEKAFLSDLEKIHDLVLKETGVDTRIIRFPGGSSNTISGKYCKGLMKRLVKDVEDAGYIYFDWNCDNGDAGGKETTADYQIKHATKYPKNAENIMILMHDIDVCGVNLEALSGIIEFYQSKGADFGVITEDSPLVRHKVKN